MVLFMQPHPVLLQLHVLSDFTAVVPLNTDPAVLLTFL